MSVAPAISRTVNRNGAAGASTRTDASGDEPCSYAPGPVRRRTVARERFAASHAADRVLTPAALLGLLMFVVQCRTAAAQPPRLGADPRPKLARLSQVRTARPAPRAAVVPERLFDGPADLFGVPEPPLSYGSVVRVDYAPRPATTINGADPLSPEPFREAVAHDPPERLPEGFAKPRPLVAGDGFYDAAPVTWTGRFRWPWGGAVVEPTTVVYGQYRVFGTAFEQNREQFAGVGHDLLVDVDVSLGATERLHAQFRPLAGKNSGGSLLRLNEDVDYLDNSNLLPQRLWLEADLSEVAGGLLGDVAHADVLLTAGLFPYVSHNGLLIADDIGGVLLSKNNLAFGPFSNVLGQALFAFDEVDAYDRFVEGFETGRTFTGPGFGDESDVRLAGTHWQFDWGRRFVEASWMHLWDVTESATNADYLALSVTQLLGPSNVAGRALLKFGDEARFGDGQLFVLEANRRRLLDRRPCGFDEAVLYATAFWATEGWTPVSGGTFDRLRSTFAIDPLTPLTVSMTGVRRRGVTLGAELFHSRRDLTFTPEIAADFPDDAAVLGLGATLRQRVGRRSQLSLRGLATFTDDDRFRRQGVFLEWTTFF